MINAKGRLPFAERLHLSSNGFHRIIVAFHKYAMTTLRLATVKHYSLKVAIYIYINKLLRITEPWVAKVYAYRRATSRRMDAKEEKILEYTSTKP